MNRIHELTAGRDNNAIAIFDHDDSPISFGQLETLADAFAEQLKKHGVRGGDRVVLLSENSATYAVAVLALSRLDAWTVLVNARVTNAELDYIKSHSGARCIIFTPEASPASQQHADAHNAIVLGEHVCGKLLVSPVDQNAQPENVDPGPEQVAAMIYTSGTTGQPKGVMITHANLISQADITLTARNMGPGDDLLAVLPGTHIFGFASILLPSLKGGSTLRLKPRFTPDIVLDAFDQGVTHFAAVPQMYSAILKRLEEKGISKLESSLQRISSGGAPLDPAWKKKVEAALGIPLYNGYGLTESTSGIAVQKIEDLREDTAVGHACPQVELKLDNPNEEGVGELLARGPVIMKGYYKNAEGTAATITDDGFLRTGDLAKIDADGSVHIVGRCKELIINSGFNVYPPEVEMALNNHAAVTHAAVVGRSRDGNEEVLGFVAVAPNQNVTGEELRKWAREQLAPYKVPKYIVVAGALPQAATGKILKNKLITHFEAELKALEEAIDA